MTVHTDAAPWQRMVVGNVVVDLVDRRQAISLIMDSLSAVTPLAVVSANLHHIHNFVDDESWPSSTTAVNEPTEGLRWLTLLDGMPLVRKANALTGRRWAKLSGSDLIDEILASAADRGARVGFLGGAAETHRQLRVLVGERHPTVCIAGTWAPTRAEVNNAVASERIAAEIRAAKIDILVVGLGKPRQEQWIARFGADSGAKVLLAFGAVVDFLARRVRRAPKLVSNAGAEWAWRLMLEPRRLSRRYLIDCPPALLLLKRTARLIAAAAAPTSPGVAPGAFVRYGERAEIAALVVTYNSASQISSLIGDLRVAALERPIRLIVVDNDSGDDTVKLVRAHDDIVLVESGGNIGYAGGINAGLPHAGSSDNILILNPDLELAPGAVTKLLAAAEADRVGAVVPLILDGSGAITPSLYREPSLTRAFGDALLGSKMPGRPGATSEFALRTKDYIEAHDVDWAAGAALLVPSAVARELGDWHTEFFLYSEEVDYFRRIRASGRRIRFEPSAVVQHLGGGSGRSPALANLKAVNRVRYIERYHGLAYSTLFRSAAMLAEALRSYDADHRRTLAVLMDRRRWLELPRAAKPLSLQCLSGLPQRGAVIVPACNEAALIERTLGQLSRAAVEGFIELIVVCNGCTDDTADRARSVPGARVLELEQGSKPAALNAGDSMASLWPRLYLDADMQISAEAVLAVLDRLALDDVLVARPNCEYDTSNASTLVRSYYRAANRIPQHRRAMWGSGVYGLNLKGHQRFGSFPMVTVDDLFVDTRFDAHEKVVVTTSPAVVKAPADTKSLLAILRRSHRGGVELLSGDHGRVRDTGLETALSVVSTIRGPRSAVDAAVFLGMALVRRFDCQTSQVWERDESSRVIE